MNSNQDNKQKELEIPMTGIEVMNYLSIDVPRMFHLIRKDLLLPYHQKNLFLIKLKTYSRCDSPESTLSGLMFRKSDVDDFKKNYKDWLEKVKTPIASMDNKEMKRAQSEESNELENFIRSLQVSYVSDTEIKIRQESNKSKIYSEKELGFKKVNSKTWNALINILKSQDHFYYVGKARGAKRERKKSYDVRQKVLDQINEKLVPFFNETYQLRLSKEFRIYELIPEKKEAPGIYRFKFQIKNNSDTDIKDFKELSKDELLSKIETLSSEYETLSKKGDEEAEKKILKIKDQLNATVGIACEKEWLTQHRAAAYHNPQPDDSLSVEYTIDKEDSNQED